MKENKLAIKSLAMLVIALMVTSTMVLSAEEADNNTIDTLEITKIQVENKYSKVLETPERKESAELISLTESSNNILGIDIPIFDFDDVEALNPTLVTDGATQILAASEYFVSAFEADIFFRPSIDGGQTWSNDILSYDLPSIGALPEKPCLDFSGDLGGLGSFVDINSGGFPEFRFPDLTDPEADGGWSYLTWTSTDDFDSMDVAGWNSQWSPHPEWTNGMIGFSGDISGTTNVIYMIWATSETGGQGIWTGGADDSYEWENFKLDQDLVTGMHWEAYEITSNEGEFEPGIEIDWIQMNGEDNWWNPGENGGNDWFGSIIEGASNPSIDSNNGMAYCVFEFNGGISCAYTNDNAASDLSLVEISATGTDPHVSVIGDSVLITYVDNGDLISVVSEDFGNSWEEETINDESGAVLEGSHNSHCHGPYIAWSDDRNGVPDIFFDAVGSDIAIIEIDSISGGLGVTVEVSNTGTADAVDTAYSISATGGILGMIDSSVEDTVTINAGDSATLNLPLFIGFGAVTVDVVVGSASESVEGTQILIFTSI